MNKLNKILSLYNENKEISLLSELSYEISNFKKFFKGKVKSTYILSPSGSSLFGIDIYEDKLFLGVPDIIWDDFLNMRWYMCNFIKNTPGLFLVFDMGIEPNNRPVAIRIHTRSGYSEIFAKFKKIKFVKIDKHGIADLSGRHTSFTLRIKETDLLSWENFKRH